MRVLRALPEVAMWALIAITAIVDLAVYTHVVQGENASAHVRVAGTIGPSTPGSGDPQPQATVSAADRAERNDSESLPGRFVPPQGRQHTDTYPLRQHIPFCSEGGVSNECYGSTPPTSGLHLPVQGNVRLADGNRVKVPPDPGVYDFQIPREAIPHIEEHAGVYVGYHCTSDACNTTIGRLKDLVTQEISLGARVVLSPDDDLDSNTIGVVAWTRLDAFDATAYTDERVRTFIKAHSCRFDPERFCSSPQIN